MTILNSDTPVVASVAGAAVEGHILPRKYAAAATPPVVLKMPRTKNVPRRSEGGDAYETERAAAALAAALVPAPHPNARPLLGAVGVSGPYANGVTIKQEAEEEEEEEEPRRDGEGPGPARVLASRSLAAIAAAPTPTSAPNHDAPAAGGAGCSGGGSGAPLVKEEEAEETLGQLRDRLALALAHGPVRVDSHIKVEDSTSGEDTDRNEERGEEVTDGEGGYSWGRRTSRRTPGEAGGHLAGAPLRTGRLGRRGGELSPQPTTSHLSRLHWGGNREVRKSDRRGATAWTSSPEGIFGRPPRGSHGARV